MDISEILPAGWLHEEIRSYGVILTAVEAGRQQGSVTVNEAMRSFKLGVCPVRERGDYAGRGWKADLYRDAVKALQDALALRPSKPSKDN